MCKAIIQIRSLGSKELYYLTFCHLYSYLVFGLSNGQIITYISMYYCTYLPKVRPYITFEVCMHQGSIMEIFSSCPVLESLELQNCSIQDSNHHDHHLQCRQRSHSTDVKLKQLIIVSKCSEAFIDSLLKWISGTQWGLKAFRSQFKNLQRPYN